ncbi:MAG: DUF1549 and DUF1553 domain-containing protein [Candidatus Hydrogenedentes bacterium]|nr:DUF1549 and DUF1553 domain-containing protein [Candidatus Hydrogenedentota bacterium]
MQERQLRLRVCAWVGVALCASAAWGDTLSVYPSSVQLDNQNDHQRVILVGTRDDGVTLNRTSEAAVTFAPEGIAKWEGGKLQPVADGETVATFAFGDQSLTVPVKVLNASVNPSPSFRNDIVPVLMRAGCNSGKCHGSFQGKNGFRVSLFGFDPTMDYINLTRDNRARRLNTGSPEESLMLTKATGQVDHTGGTRFTHESPLYKVIERWISEGAHDDAAPPPALVDIEILPKNAVLEGKGVQYPFLVRGIYADGSDRDVTDLTLLSTSDDLTATIDDSGVITSGDRGEASIMARYGTFAVVSQVMVLPEGLALQWPDVAERNYVDKLIFDKLKKLRIPPAELCSDETFVRRVYLDILGVVPTVDETKAFLADTAPDKREKLIDTLLQRPEFPELWAMKWADLLRVQTIANTVDRKALQRYNDWLRQSITANKPLDQLVRELLTAQGGNFTAPATNFYVAEPSPTQMAENVAQVFLGIQIKCAQCHNHPFERWTMDDYYAFSAFFAQVGSKGSSDPRERITYDRRSGDVNNLKDGRVMAPKYLGGAEPDCSNRDRRAALAEWITSPDNPWFAKNIANRVWDQFFGRGITNPPDDVRVTNPPSHPELETELAKHLVEYNYDLRKLVRDICTSYTYQMSTQPRDPSIKDERNFSHALVRRLPAEQLLDAVCNVTESKVKFPNLPLGARAAEVADGPSGNYFLTLFGRPARNTVSACERRSEATLAQVLHLVNGDTVTSALKAPGGRVERLSAADKPPADIVQELWLAAYSRTPTADEQEKFSAYITAATDKRAAVEDLFWSVLNSKEFVFNH